ncbi:MAG TPA: hypothetical protein VK400_11210 [Pyrinomonadaceae bacterium]|nr:hypothetical protein [Pyrinomonadaceae bacterium]
MKRYYPQFLALISTLFVCFNAVSAQENQPALVSFISPGVNYGVLKMTAAKTQIRLNLDGEGTVVAAELLKGNSLLFVKIKNDLAKWKFDKASESQRCVLLEVDYSDKKLIISPYQVEVKITIPEVLSLVPEDWEEGSHSCEVHQEILIKDKITISYGHWHFLYDYDAYQSAKPKSFPYANSRFGGGDIEEDSPKYVEILYCQKCRAIEKVWLKENVKENQK